MSSFNLIQLKTKLECVRCGKCYTLLGMQNVKDGMQTFILLKCKCHQKKIEVSFHKDLDIEKKNRILSKYIHELMEDAGELELWGSPK